MGGSSLGRLVTTRQRPGSACFKQRMIDWNAQQALPCQIKTIDSPGVNTTCRIATA